MNDTATIARPDQEYYQRLIQELGSAKEEQAALRFIKLYDTTDVPGVVTGSHRPKVLADFIYAGNHKVPRGKPLDDAILAAQIRREALESLLEEYNAEEQAWIDQESPAPDVEPFELGKKPEA